jgi:RNA recognition motif-containing protein
LNSSFAFVEYEDRKDAEEALEQCNGFDVHGRRLKLDWDIGLVKKDIKPVRSAGTTTENSTAETSPQPQTSTATEASTPVEGEPYGHLDMSAASAKDIVDATAYKRTDEPIPQSDRST